MYRVFSCIMGYMKKKPSVSVVVASHRPAMVSGLLHSLLRQRECTVVLEVLVVTDYPNGDLQRDFPAMQWTYIADTSISVKRNRGASAARAPVLAFIDDDCIAASDWVERGYAWLIRHPHCAAVEGYTSIESNSGYAPQALREYRRLEKRGFRTNNLFIRTASFREAGGFDERFTVQREDIDLAFTMMDRGMTIGYSRDIGVTHRFRHWETWDLLKNCWNRRFDPLLFKKHPKRYLTMFGIPLPPTQVVMLLLHLLFLLTVGRKRRTGAAAGCAEIVAALFFGIRRSGMRPFLPRKLLLESLQIVLAPVVTVAALVCGGGKAVSCPDSRSRTPGI